MSNDYANMIFEALTRPYDIADVKWRVGTVSKDQKKAKPLCYVDVRTVEQRLDDVIGSQNWSNEYRELPNGTIICRITMSVIDPDTERGFTFYKEDGAGQTDFEAEKGGLSDAFKRASVKFGMGRYLYSVDGGWVQFTGNKYEPFSPDTLARLAAKLPNHVPKNAASRDEYDRLTQEYRGLTEKKVLLSWGDRNADKIQALPESYQKKLRAEFKEWILERAA